MSETDARVAPGGYVLSGWWRRAAAMVIDSVMITGTSSAILWAVGFDLGEYWGEDSSLLIMSRATDLLFLIADAALAGVYYVLTMVAWDGRTVGKRASRIRVIRTDGAPMDASTVLKRQILLQYVAFGLVPLLCIADYLWPLRDRENRAVHDVLIRTRVIRDASRMDGPFVDA